MQSVLKINRKLCKNVAVCYHTNHFHSCTRLNFFLLCELGRYIQAGTYLYLKRLIFSLYFPSSLAFYITYHEGNIADENIGYVVFTVDEITKDQLGNRGW